MILLLLSHRWRGRGARSHRPAIAPSAADSLSLVSLDLSAGSAPCRLRFCRCYIEIEIEIESCERLKSEIESVRPDGDLRVGREVKIEADRRGMSHARL